MSTTNPPKAKFDPLEAAKVTEAKNKADEATQQQTDWTAPPAPPVAKPAGKPAVKAPVVAPKGPRKLYRVKADKLVAFGGGYTAKLKAGTVLDPAGYGGAAGIEKLIAGGLQLEEFEG